MTTTTAKERPILFSAEMVRAILAGKKIQTRRLVKLDSELKRRGCTSLEGSFVDKGFGDGEYLKVPGPDDTYHRLYSPHGFKGDRLWVRENFLVQPALWAQGHGPQPIHYSADTSKAQAEDYVGKPCIHLPRWGCRIELELTYVRVERLQSITEKDAIAEGFMAYWLEECKKETAGVPHAVGWYAALWDRINGSGSWAANPWVWVLEFKRVS